MKAAARPFPSSRIWQHTQANLNTDFPDLPGDKNMPKFIVIILVLLVVFILLAVLKDRWSR